MNRCKLFWLLGSAKVFEKNVEILMFDPWILKEGEVLANKGCRDN